MAIVAGDPSSLTTHNILGALMLILDPVLLRAVHTLFRSLPRNADSRWAKATVRDTEGRPWLQLNWQPEHRIVHVISDPCLHGGRTVYYGHVDAAGVYRQKRRCAGLAQMFERLAFPF